LGLSAFLTSPLSRLLLNPTYDRLAVAALARFYFPVSRLWAMALADGGDGDAILAKLPRLARHRQRLERAIAQARDRARAQAVAHARWEEALFGGNGVKPEALARIELARAGACQSLMTARSAFLPLVRAARLTPFGWDIQPHDAVEARHGARLADLAAAFRMPERLPRIELSQPVPGDGFETLWLRADTTVAGRPDTLWARVERPSGAPNAGALVFTHGIAMETEFWRESSSLTSDLAREGITVIRPEGPWHGHRRVAGTFGGEPTLALGPMGLLDYFEAHVRELALLAAWARDASGGPVAVGGVSLGALTAQMALMAAPNWPAPCRPDAAFLVTTAGSLMDVALAGSLTRALGMPRQLAESGWDRAALQRWMPLLEPGAAIALDPARVVVLLGTEDEILPYPSGRDLVAAWDIPPENLFVTPLGHFSAALGLYRNPAPLARLSAVLREVK
jgi:pimeloyl-ACP methyl ester carboxylesterase